jgi:glycine/D-amino acid oxidase-like deaminating enzyme
MRIAVLGGGFQGCCLAIALAEQGARVTLFDRNAGLMTQAAAANKGKIHLGYVYAGDSSLATARLMIRGALKFEPLMHRYLGVCPRFVTSTPFVYGVHRDSLLPVDQFGGYLRAVHALVMRPSLIAIIGISA